MALYSLVHLEQNNQSARLEVRDTVEGEKGLKVRDNVERERERSTSDLTTFDGTSWSRPSRDGTKEKQ